MNAYLAQIKWIVEDLVETVLRILKRKHNKITALVLSLTIAGTQILPAAFAESAPELRRQLLEPTAPATSVKNVHVPESLPADQVPSGVLVPEGPLSKPDVDQTSQNVPNIGIPKPLIKIGRLELPGVREMRKQIIDNLVDQFGMSRDQIERWIKQGLLKIDYDLKNNKATVTFDLSLKIQNPYDPMSSDPVKEITYEFGYRQILKGEIYAQDYQALRFPKTILKTTIKAGDKTYDVTFAPFAQIVASSLNLYPEERGIQTAHVKVTGKDGQELYSMDVYEKDGTRTFEIHYPQLQEDGVSSRTITSKRLEDGKYHVDTVRDFDQNGQLLVTSKFNYQYLKFDDWGVPINLRRQIPHLVSITRTDKDGKVISEITLMGNEAANIRVRNGKPETVTFKDIQDLLKQAAEKENLKKTPEEAQKEAMQNAVVSQLQNLFGFTAEQIQAWIKQGLLKFAFDAKTLKVTLTMDPSIKLSNGHVNPLDPLGSGELPRELEFQLQDPSAKVFFDEGFGGARPFIYEVTSVYFKLNEKSYEVDWYFEEYKLWGQVIHRYSPLPVPYSSIRAIRIYDQNGELQSTTTYRLDHGAVIADVVYAKPANGVSSREVRIRNFSGRGFVISAVADKNSSGEIIGITHFQWSVDASGYTLNGIRRVDGQGKETVQIRDVRDGSAYVLIPGSKDPDQVRFANFEELLNSVGQMENDRLSPESKVGEIFKTIIGRDASEEELKLIVEGIKQGKIVVREGRLYVKDTFNSEYDLLDLFQKGVENIKNQLGLGPDAAAQLKLAGWGTDRGAASCLGDMCTADLIPHSYVRIKIENLVLDFGGGAYRRQDSAAILQALAAAKKEGRDLADVESVDVWLMTSLSNVRYVSLKIRGDDGWVYYQVEQDKVTRVSEVDVVKHSFKTIIGRDASAEELKFFQSQLQAGKSIDEIKKSLEAAKKAIDDLSKRLNLSEEQRTSIRIVSSVNDSMADPLRNLTVLKLYQNEFRFEFGRADWSTAAAISAIKDLVAHGVSLGEIKIDSITQNPYPERPSNPDMHTGLYIQATFNIWLSTAEGKRWLYRGYELQDNLTLLEEINGNRHILYNLDGSKTTMTYDTDQQKNLVSMMYETKDGQSVTVDLTKAEITGPFDPESGKADLDLRALAVALKDLLGRTDGGLPADGKLILKNYTGQFFSNCTEMVGNNSCQNRINLTLQSSTTLYRFDMTEIYRTDAHDVKIPTSSQYTIKQFSKEPVRPSGVEIEVSVLDPSTNSEIRRKFSVDLTQDGGAVWENGALVGEVSKNGFSHLVNGADGYFVITLHADPSFKPWGLLTGQQVAYVDSASSRSEFTRGSAFIEQFMEVVANLLNAPEKLFAFVNDAELTKLGIVDFEHRLGSLASMIVGNFAGLPPQSELRTKMITLWVKELNQRADFLRKLKSIFAQSAYQVSALERLKGIGLVAASSEDIYQVIGALNFNQTQADTFREFKILLLDGFLNPSDYTDMKSLISYLPKSMMVNGGVIYYVDWARGVGGTYGQFSDQHFLIGIAEQGGGALEHELWHGMADFLEERNYLPEKRWIREQLFTLGSPEDRASDYGNTNYRENNAEFGKPIAWNTAFHLNLWIEKAKSGKFIGLRTLLSLHEIMAHNSGGDKLPLYEPSQDGYGPPKAYAPVETDADHNITMLELDGKRCRFTYTSDSLHILTMSIEDIQTGAKEDFTNQMGVDHQKTLSGLENTMVNLHIQKSDLRMPQVIEDRFPARSNLITEKAVV